MASRTARVAFDLKTRAAMRSQRRVAAALEVSERLDPALLVRQQASESMALARHAFATTEHYRTAITAAGLEAGDLTDPGNWRHLPVLDKATLRTAGRSLVSSECRDKDLLPSVTGGSTGEPLTVYNDARSPVAPMWWRPYRWWGVSPADHSALIYRMKHSRRQELRERLEWWPTRTIKLDARGTTPEAMDAFLERWRQVRPRLLNGYVGAVHELAAHVAARGIQVPPPVAIAVTASMLHATQRREIEEALGAPVHDCYRSAEVPWMAAQCGERDGLHVMADLRRIEVLDARGEPVAPGTTGDVVVTDLTNHAFPIIRYRIGDRGRLREDLCACGRTLPLMDPVEGRVADVLRTPSGRTVSGGLSPLLIPWSGTLRKFQLHQAADFSVELHFVAAPEAGSDAVAAACAEVVAQLRGMLADEVPVQARQVDDIVHQGGKVRLVVSALA